MPSRWWEKGHLTQKAEYAQRQESPKIIISSENTKLFRIEKVKGLGGS